VAARSVLYNVLVACTVANVLVGLTEDMPWTLTLTSLAAHASYYRALRSFPALDVDITFVVSCVLLLLHNVFAFDTFASTWYPFDEVRCAHPSALATTSHRKALLWTTIEHRNIVCLLRCHDASPQWVFFIFFSHSTHRLPRPFLHVFAVSRILCCVCLAGAIRAVCIALRQRQRPADSWHCRHDPRRRDREGQGWEPSRHSRCAGRRP
jgi:hypothetical protein